MDLKSLIARMECLPVDVPEGQNSDEVLLGMDVMLRVPHISGQYAQVVAPNHITLEKLPHSDKYVIVINTSLQG